MNTTDIKTSNKHTLSNSKKLNNNKVVTLGCRLNIFESAIIEETLSNNNIEDTIVVNTCCVTQKAEEESLNKIRKLKKENPDKHIIATGCAVHTASERLKQMPEVSKVVNNFKKFNNNAFNVKNKDVEDSLNNNSQYYTIPQLTSFTNKTRAFIQIQQGCDHRCSFCVIHKARGKSISLTEDDIIQQVKTIVKNGHKEIVLTGVDISSWNRDIFTKQPSQIGKLCKNILKEVKDLKRLRLSSLDPAVEDDDILDLLDKENRFMPHIHLSLQSMSTPVLNNMGRRHSRESASIWVKKLKQANPSVVIGADIICGFPKETEEQFIETATTLKELNIPLLHVFPYSERSETPAAKMTQIPTSTRKRRALSLIAMAAELKNNLLNSKVNNIEEVLVEAKNTGYTKDYCFVTIAGKEITKNTLCKVKVTGVNHKGLIAEPY